MMYSKGTQVRQAKKEDLLEQGELCSDWWSADLPTHKYMIKEKYMHQERAPSYIAAPVPTGSTPTAGSGLTIQPQLAQAMKLRLLALCGCNKPRQSSQQQASTNLC